jgi:hypothetical protein
MRGNLAEANRYEERACEAHVESRRFRSEEMQVLLNIETTGGVRLICSQRHAFEHYWRRGDRSQVILRHVNVG